MPLLILIADDDPGIRLAVSDYLEFSGYSVIAAENGQKALSLLQIYHPHLLISDIKMPNKDGYASLLRKSETSNRAELVRFALQNHLLDLN